MDLDLVRAFLVILEEGSLNRAALRLHCAQSSLTRQMQVLEHETGGRLLERTSMGVSVTAAGQEFAERMRPLMATVDQALESVRSRARGERSVLRIGYLLSAGRRYLNPGLEALRRSHPEVQVRLFDMSPGEQMEALRRGDLDVGLVGQEGALVAREFYSRRLARLPMLAVLPLGHPLSERPSLGMAELAGELFIGVPEREVPGRDRWLTTLCRKAGFRPRIQMESGSLAEALALVVSEQAVAIVPGHASDLPAAGVVMVPFEGAGVLWDLLVVWQRGRVAPAVKVLVQAMAEAQT